MKVMVVDDNEQNLDLLEALLSSEKYEVVCARDGLEALEHLKKGSFGLIISDILMPRMDGFQLCRECKVDPHLKYIPFIFYTATYTDRKDEEFALSLGADRFIAKPIEPQIFLATIREVIKEYEKGALTEKEPLIKDEELYLVEYNKRLIQKLEKKMLDLEMAHKTLAESEKKYRTLVTQSPDGIFIVDLQGTFLDVNKAMCERLKYSEEEFLSMKIWDIVPEKYVDLHKKRLADILRGEAPNEAAEYVVRGKDEKMHYVEVLSNPYFRENEVIGFQGIARDITERKKAEEALRESEEKYRLLVENANEAIFVIQDGMLRFFNIKNIELIGYSKEELTSTPFINFVHPDDREVALGRYLKRIRGEELTGVNFFRIIDKAGNIKWAEVNSVLISWEGRPATLNFLNDITERKRAEEALSASEERFRMLFEGAAEGILVADIESKQFKYSNPAICKMLGYTAEELVRLSVADIHHKEALGYVVAEFEAQARGEKILSPEIPCLRKDGSVIYASIATSPVVIDGRKCNVGFFMDITEHKKTEEALKQTEEQLRQSQKMEGIGRLAGGIAHDFNNLLTVIKGYSQLSLIELKENDPMRGGIEEINRAADRAADLTRQLLAFSRRQILEMRVLDLNSVLRDLDKMLRRVIGEDIELVTLLAEDLARVKTDHGQMQQVIMNLAVNAKDAMPNGGKLTIETANVELDETYARSHVAVIPGRYAMLSVSDTGVGMTAEVKEQVFEPFFTTKEKGKGTGLGLATVYGIVKQSGGNIWIYSEPGQGTTFKIYLPRVDEPLEELKEKAEVKGIPRGSETILVVEDEEKVLKLTVQILRGQGYAVLEAPHGDDALLVCEQHEGPIHLMLTDVVMPNMSGLELAKRLKAFHPEMKVLYMSGYTDNAIVHHGVLEKGMNYIQKPFTIEGLARKVREVLDN
jgi:PAS domain S-box-containing protein